MVDFLRYAFAYSIPLVGVLLVGYYFGGTFGVYIVSAVLTGIGLDRASEMGLLSLPPGGPFLLGLIAPAGFLLPGLLARWVLARRALPVSGWLH